VGGAASPEVVLLYTRKGWVLWDDGVPGRGGYYARIPGFAEQGEGRTVEQALERLADALRDHVENWDAEVDERAHAPTRGPEPPLVSWARRAGRSPELASRLRAVAGPPRLAG
jgi:predicted RNase H-like HicB family nuclease